LHVFLDDYADNLHVPEYLPKPGVGAMAYQKSLEEMEREQIIEACRTVGEFIGKLLVSAMSPKPAPVAPVLPPELNPYLLNCKAAAEFLSVSVSTLKRLTVSGQVRSVKIAGRARRYPREELEKFANRRDLKRGQSS
jgi:excisionase family DNA binding protein